MRQALRTRPVKKVERRVGSGKWLAYGACELEFSAELNADGGELVTARLDIHRGAQREQTQVDVAKNRYAAF